MQTVRNEGELSAKIVEQEGMEPRVMQRQYIRCLTDQTVLIAGDTGECFKRRDGQRWAAAGYSVDASGARPSTAPEDHTNSKQKQPAA